MTRMMSLVALAAYTLVLTTAQALAAQAPIPGAPYEHAPYGGGACSICHESDDVKNPGKITMPVNDLCLGCHEQFGSKMAGAPHVHAPVEDSCTNCHNPHNSFQWSFLDYSAPNLCISCHDAIGAAIKNAKVKHGAVTDGTSCLGCHDPHATKVEKLLKTLPYDLCVNCHNNGNLVDHDGKKLANIKGLIDSMPNKHGPVAAKDCSSCHNPHASDNFRMLTAPYPGKFYSPYDPDNYALCFTCHDPGIVNVPQTTTLTDFRHGSQNLHFLHVNKDRGRTCRACHEVHAAENPHIIRDGVPFGNSGWVLKINYRKTATGGSCAKTCHTTKEYVR